MRFIPNDALELILDSIILADEQAVCSAQPVTFFNACWPDIWTAEEAIITGGLIRPPTNNGFIYECVSGGTTDVSEPPWGTVQDAEFADSDITWKTHENFALVNSGIDAGDKTKGAGDPDGRKLTIAQKMGVTVHTTGSVTHTALIDSVNRIVRFVTVAATSLEGDNTITSGRTTLLHEVVITIRAPSEP